MTTPEQAREWASLTDKMIDAGERYMQEVGGGGVFWHGFPAAFRWHELWGAMLAASPSASETANALRDLARQVEELQADAERWRRLVNASEMAFPVLAIADDPENDCRKIYGRANMEKIVDMMDEIPATYPAK